MQTIRVKRSIVFLIITFLVFSLLPLIKSKGFDFKKNFLISDADFTDYKSMSLSDIEMFLDSHGSFLANYMENGESASEIIYNAANKYRINPKVILVTMQKEEGIITMKSFSEHALRLAMGYHSESSFYKQVYGGTKLLRDGFDFLAAKYGWKVGMPHITEDNPKYVDNAVTPQNKATASLYLYTPYIGGYYTDSGSYIGGNYIFVKIYTRWFGRSKRYSVDFVNNNFTLFVPEGNPSLFKLFIKNTSDSTVQKKLLLAATKSYPSIEVDSVELENSVLPGKTAFFTVRMPPIGVKEHISFCVFDANGNAVSPICNIVIVPVKLHVNTDLHGKNLDIFVDSDSNIPYAYIKLKTVERGGGEDEYYLINGNGFQKNTVLKKNLTVTAALKELDVSFVGASIRLNNYYDIWFLKKQFDKRFNVYINTVPKDAYVFIDNKLIGVSPIQCILSEGKHLLNVKKTGFKTISKELNVSKNLTINLSLVKADDEIVFFNSTHLTNIPDFVLRGEIISDTEYKNLIINGATVSVSNNKFSYTVHLYEGKNEIRVRTTDGKLTSSYFITLDKLPPEIKIENMPPITQNMFFEINVSVDGAQKIFINDKPCSSPSCKEFVKLRKGINEIVVKAVDRAGNISVKRVKILYTPPPPITLTLFIGKKFLYVNGFKKKIDVAPVIAYNRTMLPIRHVIEALGGKVSYDASDRSVLIKINGAVIKLFIGSNTAMVNGGKKLIDTNRNIVPFIKSGRTFLPLRFIVENIGGSVKWIPQSREIVILYPYSD